MKYKMAAYKIMVYSYIRRHPACTYNEIWDALELRYKELNEAINALYAEKLISRKAGCYHAHTKKEE